MRHMRMRLRCASLALFSSLKSLFISAGYVSHCNSHAVSGDLFCSNGLAAHASSALQSSFSHRCCRCFKCFKCCKCCRCCFCRGRGSQKSSACPQKLLLAPRGLRQAHFSRELPSYPFSCPCGEGVHRRAVGVARLGRLSGPD